MIRVARVVPTPEELAELEFLDHTCFPADEPCPKQGENLYWWIARDMPPGTLVGFAGLEYCPRENIGYLCRAGVLYDYRGRHIQRKLIAARLSFATRRGWKACVTYTLATNYASANSLAHSGFKLYGPEYPWAGPNVLYWYRRCAPQQKETT